MEQGGSCNANLSGGSGNCDLSSATPGPKTLTATYGGSTNFNGSGDTAAHQVNTPPIADDDTFSGVAGLPIISLAPGVLDGDTDPDGDAVSADPDLDSEPSNGVISLNADGGFIYTPNVGFVGTDSFTYHATDGRANSAPATVTLNVGP